MYSWKDFLLRQKAEKVVCRVPEELSRTLLVDESMLWARTQDVREMSQMSRNAEVNIRTVEQSTPTGTRSRSKYKKYTLRPTRTRSKPDARYAIIDA